MHHKTEEEEKQNNKTSNHWQGWSLMPTWKKKKKKAERRKWKNHQQIMHQTPPPPPSSRRWRTEKKKEGKKKASASFRVQIRGLCSASSSCFVCILIFPFVSKSSGAFNFNLLNSEFDRLSWHILVGYQMTVERRAEYTWSRTEEGSEATTSRICKRKGEKEREKKRDKEKVLYAVGWCWVGMRFPTADMPGYCPPACCCCWRFW